MDLYLGGGRLSRVDSYVRDIHTPYEYEVPSTYERYRSASRPGAYASTINGYTVSLLVEFSVMYLTVPRIKSVNWRNIFEVSYFPHLLPIFFNQKVLVDASAFRADSGLCF